MGEFAWSKYLNVFVYGLRATNLPWIVMLPVEAVILTKFHMYFYISFFQTGSSRPPSSIISRKRTADIKPGNWRFANSKKKTQCMLHRVQATLIARSFPARSSSYDSNWQIINPVSNQFSNSCRLHFDPQLFLSRAFDTGTSWVQWYTQNPKPPRPSLSSSNATRLQKSCPGGELQDTYFPNTAPAHEWWL